MESEHKPRIVSVHFPGKDRQRLEAAAKRDGRSASNLAAKLIREGLDRMDVKPEAAQKAA